jgi:hypothetical protein
LPASPEPSFHFLHWGAGVTRSPAAAVAGSGITAKASPDNRGHDSPDRAEAD